MNSEIKIRLRSAWYRVRHPAAVLGAGTFVQNGAHLARGVRTGRNCAVFDPAELLARTTLADEVVIGAGARVAESTVGSSCTLEPRVELFRSSLADHIQLQREASLTETRIGRFTYIGRQSCLNLVTVGAFSSIGPHTLAGLGDHPSDLGTTSPAFYSTRAQCGATFATRDLFPERQPIQIGHDVWIGARVFVRDGVRIGDGAVVAAGAVVSREVPPYAVVGGTPARVLRMRFSDSTISRLLALAWWDWPDSRLRAAQPLLASPHLEEFLDWAEAGAMPRAEPAPSL